MSKRILTEHDVDYLETRFKEVFVTKDVMTKTKSDLMDTLDKILKEVIATRDEITVLAHHSTGHTDRLEKLEKLHPHYKHSIN
jgi:hypothetical protein